MKGLDVERDPDVRCHATDVEKPGRTHLCRLTTHEHGEHTCICQHSWTDIPVP